MRKELNETAFSLKAGEHSRVIATAEGYYILQVDDVKSAHTIPLGDVRDDIEKILLQQQRAKMQEDWVKDLRAKAYIFWAEIRTQIQNSGKNSMPKIRINQRTAIALASRSGFGSKFL